MTNVVNKFISKAAGKVKYQTVLSLRKLSYSIDHLAYHIEAAKFLTIQEWKILERNKRFSLCHKGRRAFIIGNGPSLNSQNLSLLKNEITFTCNSFYLHPILSQWQPTYNSMIDPSCFDGFTPMGTWFEETCEKMPDTKFFVPLLWQKTIVEKNLLPEERTFYCDFAGKMAIELKSIDPTQPIPGPESVSLLGIYLAIYMGCNPIYLIGMDHDWLASRSRDTHYYQDSVVRGALVSADLSRVPYETDVKSLLVLWAGYKNIKTFAEPKGIKIYNATNGGFLDVFERVRYESLFVHTQLTLIQSRDRLQIKK